MKLGEKTRGRKPKGVDLVIPTREPGLNEQIGLPVALEEHIRSFLEVDFGDLNHYVSQAETAVSLITLFPAEADKFRQQVPIAKLVRDVENRKHPLLDDANRRGLRAVRQLAPKEALYIGKGVEDAEITAIPLERVSMPKIERAASAVILYPHRREEILKMVESELHNMGSDSDFWIEDGSFLWTMRDAMILDPSLHAHFRTFALNNRERFERLFSKIKKVGVASEAKGIAAWFAVYKLLLANEVRLTSSGILLAVESENLSGNKPLPERSLAV